MARKAKVASWEQRASRFVKAELKRANVTYDQLADRLGEQGLTETRASIANKLSRGTFSAVFLLATMTVLGQRTIMLDNI